MADLAETFASLKKAGLSLNPNKCIFGVHKGKVLGCLVSTKGIEANPDKVKALWSMEEPRSIRNMKDSGFKQIYLSLRRPKLTVLQGPSQCEQIRVGPRAK